MTGSISLSYQIHELREPQSEFDGDAVARVGHGSDEPVVAGQQVVEQPARVRVSARRRYRQQREKHQPGGGADRPARRRPHVTRPLH